MKSLNIQLVVLSVMLVGLSACGSSKNAATDSDSTVDISWLATSLQDEGVYVRERGAVGLSISAFESTRFVLDNRETLDVFQFESEREASSNAYVLVNRYPSYDIFRKATLVVVRQSSRDTGLSQTLFKLLGGTI